MRGQHSLDRSGYDGLHGVGIPTMETLEGRLLLDGTGALDATFAAALDDGPLYVESSNLADVPRQDRPDLVISNVQYAAGSYFPGDQIRVTGTVTNQGVTDVPEDMGYLVQLVLAVVEVNGPTPVVQLIEMPAGLESGGQADFEGWLSIPLNQASAWYHVLVLVNADGRVWESNVDNNMWAGTSNVRVLPGIGDDPGNGDNGDDGDDGDDEDLEPSFWLGRRAGHANRQTFTDSQGNAVTVRYNGPGRVAVTLTDGAADNADIYLMEVMDDGGQGQLRILVRGRNTTDVGDVLLYSNLRALQAPKANLIGNLNFFEDVETAGTLRRLVLGSIADEGQQRIHLGEASLPGRAWARGTVVVVGDVQALTFTSDGAVRDFTASSWNGLAGEDPLDVGYDGDDLFQAVSVERFRVPGGIQGLTIDLTGTNGLALARLQTPSLANVQLIALADVGNLAARQIVSSVLSANSIRQLRAQNGITGLVADLTSVNGFALRQLQSADVVGLHITTQSHIVNFNVRSIADSSIFAGVSGEDTSGNGVLDLPTAFDPGDALARIGNFRVRGLPGGMDSFINTNIAADRIERARIRFAGTDPAGEPFGIAVQSLPQLIYRDANRANNVNLRHPLAGEHQIVDNFVVRII